MFWIPLDLLIFINIHLTTIHYYSFRKVFKEKFIIYSLRIWPLTTHRDEERYTISHTKEVTCFVLTADSQHVVTGSRDASLKVWQVIGGKLTQVLLLALKIIKWICSNILGWWLVFSLCLSLRLIYFWGWVDISCAEWEYKLIKVSNYCGNLIGRVKLWSSTLANVSW